MDKYDQRKITRNLVIVKERVEGDLDHVVDRLIEKDIFTIQTKVKTNGIMAYCFIHF